ncbi:hypothetical protein L21_0759 [Methanoculleus chikugoensis]|jgi:hypothetical protein|uniref:Uncharacterized protein n=1 Tax=Methanoculleus chikugoensis TaxID=118126 RepID=A0A1M4MIZ2_9EURY|nr:hypothetical protein [Methanoculleus chikugoensis]MDD4567454.1 hypothetical protein [Methanoculleus chikugoensis]NMA10253.1 hypothetical protein [Methanomicrobiales archaeon]SCL74875.1 hypothetical protein L21_0759 [Methanoculleus chikugoensis]
MPRVRINDGDLPTGTGVEGGRKKKPDEAPAPGRREPERETAKKEESRGKSRRGEPLFGDADDADIFYTKKK